MFYSLEKKYSYNILACFYVRDNFLISPLYSWKFAQHIIYFTFGNLKTKTFRNTKE